MATTTKKNQPKKGSLTGALSPKRVLDPIRRLGDQVGDRADRAVRAARTTASEPTKEAVAQARSARTTALKAVSTAMTAAKKGRTAGKKFVSAAGDGARAATKAARSSS